MNKYYDPKQLEPNKSVKIDIVERKHGMKLRKTFKIDELTLNYERGEIGYIELKSKGGINRFLLAIGIDTLDNLYDWLKHNT